MRPVKLFAIGDLHLPGNQDKPMDIFGRHWEDHAERIRQAWQATVSPADWVLVPGDISWAMRLEDMTADLAYLGGLPGNIVIIRGNHDYWWQSIGKVRRALPPNVTALQNDYVALPGQWAVCGTRGWELPQNDGVTAHDIKIFEREVQRLRLSLRSARKDGYDKLIVMLHYPPADSQGMPTGLTAVMEEFGVAICVYGHLHGDAGRRHLRGVHRGITYCLSASDALQFQPVCIMEIRD